MSRFEDDRRTTPISDGLIDRLVDGELDEGARAALLARLEAEPGGWRRCALAFLEAQAWREAVPLIAATGADSARPVDGAAGPVQPFPAGAPRSGRPSLRLRLGPAAIAAAVLVAFAAGWLASTASRGDAEAPVETSVIAGSQPPAAPTDRGPIDRIADPEDRAGRAATPVTFHQDDGEPDPAAGVDPLSSVPLRKQLEAQGYRVERSQGLMSMGLNNGRTVEVPVDEVKVRYVGNQVY